MICRLCHSREMLSLPGADERNYYLCGNCRLISTDEKQLPERQEEQARYLSHQNGTQHEGYVKFLRRALDPARPFLRAGMKGLDYGCGHAPTLSSLVRASGLQCEDYDPLFVHHDLDGTFDFLFSTEVFEHFFCPEKAIRRIRSLLEPNGILIVMTERWKDEERFSKWYYTRDRTHVSFYHSDTFEFICRRFGFRSLFDDGERVIILERNGA